MSLRVRVLLLVLAITLPSLAVMGVWLTRSVDASADRMLRGRLIEMAEGTAAEAVHRWAGLRGELLPMVEDTGVQRALAAGQPSAGARLDAHANGVAPAVLGLRLATLDGRALWRRGETDRPGTLPVRLPVYGRSDGARLGTLTVWIESGRLFPGPRGPATGGAMISALDPATGAAVLGLPFDLDALDRDRFSWGGEEWLLVRRPIAEPRLDLLVAAPRTPELAAVGAATREGLLLLLVLAAAALMLGWVWSGRLTGSLRRLAHAADQIAAGNLEARVAGAGPDEVGRVAAAFDRMARGLSETLRRLTEREALAAVGQFSAELAHEIRNPLTAVRLDLRYVEERLPAESPLREAQLAALAEVERLDATVSGALLLSRTGALRFEPLDLRGPLEEARGGARAAFEATGARLDVGLPERAVPVSGDADALRRLFLNLLLNAADAAGAAGRTAMRGSVGADSVVVRIEDDGPGITPQVLPHIFQPQFTTKAGGSGFGLAIAERIARAHGGVIEVESVAGAGAAFTVRLPLHADVTGPPEVLRNDASPATPGSPDDGVSPYRKKT